MKKISILFVVLSSFIFLVACGNGSGNLAYNDLPNHIGNNKPNLIPTVTEGYLNQPFFMDAKYLNAKGVVKDEYTSIRTRNMKKALENHEWYLDKVKKEIDNQKSIDYDRIASKYGDAYYEYGMVDKYVVDKKSKDKLHKGYLKILNGYKNIYEKKDSN